MAIKRSTASFAAVVDGVPKVIPVGFLAEDGHPLIKGREHLFQDVETHVASRGGRVEQATAEPGEKRTLPKKPPARTSKAAQAGENE